MSGRETMLDRTIAEFLGDVAARTPAPGGGAVAATAVSLAASLVEMACRFSTEHWPEASVAAERAAALRTRVAPLAQADADAYAAVLAAPKDDRQDALAGAAAVPLAVAEAAAEVASLAAAVAEAGNPNLCGDAVTAALLAEAGARAAATLVEINLGDPADERVALARQSVEAARYAGERRSRNARKPS